MAPLRVPNRSTVAPAFTLVPRRAALLAAAVELLVVDARILLHFDERFDAGVEIEADARDTGILVEIAVGIARGFAVGQHGILVLHAVEGALERHDQAVEGLHDAERAAERGIDRQAGETGRKVRGAGLSVETRTRFSRTIWVSRVTSMRPSIFEFRYGRLSDGTKLPLV